MSVVGVIPARGGSKGIPRKNVRDFGGYPLIAWTIAAALESSAIERLIVSTDDPEIAEVARAAGADVPFMRPAHLAQDDTPDLPVFAHVLAWLGAQEQTPEILVHLRATSPLRPRGMIDEGVARLRAEPRADCVRAVTEATQTPYKMWRVGDGLLEPVLRDGGPEAFNTPRQQLPGVLWQTGSLDVIRAAAVMAGSMTGRAIAPLEIDPVYAIDLDSELDWALGEFMLPRLRDIVIPQVAATH